tara:strand:+ start:1174 stop:1347 length:174 start_codon:yes stop_codon:yes gene_type:complete
MRTLEEVYLHQVNEGLGHWMKNNKRNPSPQKIFWNQDDRHPTSFYWIFIPVKNYFPE